MDKIARYIAVAGTHGAKHDWPRPGSRFSTMLQEVNLRPVLDEAGQPFWWNMRLNGWHWWHDLGDWIKSAEQLIKWSATLGLPLEDMNIIAHSHGGNVVLAAISRGLKVRTLTTVSTPPRYDKIFDYDRILANIGFWQHIYDSKRDWTATVGPTVRRFGFGSIGDGVFRGRIYELPGVLNRGHEGIGHSGALLDPKFERLWIDRGWVWSILEAKDVGNKHSQPTRGVRSPGGAHDEPAAGRVPRADNGDDRGGGGEAQG